jgi:hypothetical protein
MAQPSKLNQLGLDDDTYRRVTSWMAELAIELSPGTRVRRNGSEIRIGRKSSLAIYADGHWRDYEADEGGRGPRSLIQHLRPGIGLAEARQIAVEWLRTHLGTGSGNATADEGEDSARRTRHAELVRQVLRDMTMIKDTLAERYLASRALHGEWPGLVGFLADDERPGEGRSSE